MRLRSRSGCRKSSCSFAAPARSPAQRLGSIRRSFLTLQDSFSFFHQLLIVLIKIISAREHTKTKPGELPPWIGVKPFVDKVTHQSSHGNRGWEKHTEIEIIRVISKPSVIPHVAVTSLPDMVVCRWTRTSQ